MAWKIAGYYGLDYLVLPLLGVPGHPGKLFGKGSGTVTPMKATAG